MDILNDCFFMEIVKRVFLREKFNLVKRFMKDGCKFRYKV